MESLNYSLIFKMINRIDGLISANENQAWFAYESGRYTTLRRKNQARIEWLNKLLFNLKLQLRDPNFF